MIRVCDRQRKKIVASNPFNPFDTEFSLDKDKEFWKSIFFFLNFLLFFELPMTKNENIDIFQNSTHFIKMLTSDYHGILQNF